MMFVEALGRIKAPAGFDSLVNTSLFDGDEEIRLAASIRSRRTSIGPRSANSCRRCGIRTTQS